MNFFPRNITILLMATFVLLLSIGMIVSKVQCKKGSKVFIGTEVSNCKLKKEIETCGNKKQVQKSCEKTENLPKKESKLLQFDFETLELKELNLFDASLVQLYLTLIYDEFYSVQSEFLTLNHYADAPPLVNKPILSQIQSFLL